MYITNWLLCKFTTYFVYKVFTPNNHCILGWKTNMTDERKTVVCIEDETEMIELVKLILGRNKFDVIGAVGGLEGLKKISEFNPDLVLLDLMMPEMDGWEVYQKMKASEDTKDIPVIVVTAKAQSIDRVLGLHIARVDDYITKPFSPNELLESVERVLHSSA